MHSVQRSVEQPTYYWSVCFKWIYKHRLFCGIRDATTKAVSFAERLAYSN